MSSPGSRRAVAFVACVAAIVFVSASASADGDSAAADVLFAEGKRLLGAGDVKAACPKFAESYRLDPALGALLNLASCHEKEGRVATAWSEYRQAEAEASRAGDRREAFSRKQAEALEPRLPRLTLVLGGATPGLTVTRNGVPVGEGSFGAELPVDPGVQEVTATAEGYKPMKKRVDMAEATRESVTIPALDPEPKAPGAAVAPAPERGSVQRPVGFVLGAAGVAALIVGGVFVGLTAGKKGSADPHCPLKVCDAEGAAAIASARTYAWAADFTLGGGAVLAAVGGVLILTSRPAPKGPTPTSHLRVTPSFGLLGGGIEARGEF